ncbi:MAG: hypothetical protein WBV94_11825 [Blastocatellia bacterium]
MKAAALILLITVTISSAPNLSAQEKSPKTADVFEKIDMLSIQGDKANQVSVRLRLKEDSLIIESRKTGGVLKEFKYADIKSAEYSYSKHPRWKAGVGTAAGSLVFAPLLFIALPIAIPLAFSKSKRHWLTIKGAEDYVVLKLDKTSRKVILPAFEVHSHIKVEALGESK